MPTSLTGNKPGFTLLELLVVLAIMTILSGVVMVAMWPALDDARMRASARTVIAALRYARSYAVSYQTDAAVLFDLERNGVSVQTRERDENGDESWRTITTQAGRFRALPGEITIADVTRDQEADQPQGDTAQTEGETTITFTATGQGEDAAITLRNSRGKERIIQVEAITGQCKLAEEK